MRLIKNKKGIFFTILALAILSLFVVSYTLYSSTQERKAVEKRITTLNNFVFSVEKDLPRRMYIAGFRIIFLFEKEIVDTGDYIYNFDSKFNEVFSNGTLNGVPEPIMSDAYFQKINEKLQENARSINAVANLTNPSITVTQEDPWNIKITLTANLLVKDNTNLASWNRTAKIVAFIPIENFADPLYMKGTKGLVPNKINKTNSIPPISGTTLQSHAENSYYINHPDAPSFLNRLKGNFTGDSNGIESLVNTNKLAEQFSAQPGYGLSVLDKSIVDYIYFGPTNPAYSVPIGMPEWTKIDNNHCSINGGPYLCS